MSVLISGGADGADSLFEKYAKLNKHTTVIHKPDTIPENLKETYDQLITFINSTFLNREYPTKKERINDMIRRDIMIGLESEIMYAVAALNDQNIIVGGTAWACYTFVNKCIGCLAWTPSSPSAPLQAALNLFPDGFIPLYLFDQQKNCWFQAQVQLIYNRISYVRINQPKLSGNYYGGIGLRDLNENGKRAIKLLYES